MIRKLHPLIHPAYVEYLDAVKNNQLADLDIIEDDILADNFDYLLPDAGIGAE